MSVSIVRFTRDHRVYNAGDMAGFSETEAAALIKLGVATEVPKPEKPDRKAAEK